MTLSIARTQPPGPPPLLSWPPSYPREYAGRLRHKRGKPSSVSKMPLASIPSPGHAAWRLGPLPIRAYALCVIAGIIVAVVVASRRYRAAGGRPGTILDVA